MDIDIFPKCRVSSPTRDGICGIGGSSSISEGGVPTIVSDASFVDDVVVPVLGKANDIYHKTSKVCSAVISVFGMYGLSVNSASGKTETSMCLRGAGSKQLRRKIAIGGNCINVEHKHGSVILRAVCNYKHVGTIFSADGKADLDVALKSALWYQQVFVRSGGHRYG